jgi:hypothetical protein
MSISDVIFFQIESIETQTKQSKDSINQKKGFSAFTVLRHCPLNAQRLKTSRLGNFSASNRVQIVDNGMTTRK